MKKSEIIDSLVKETNIKRNDVEKVFNATFDLIKKELLNENSIVITGFGVFNCNERGARKGIKPSTGEIIDIPSKRVATFRASNTFKAQLNNKETD